MFFCLFSISAAKLRLIENSTKQIMLLRKNKLPLRKNVEKQNAKTYDYYGKGE